MLCLPYIAFVPLCTDTPAVCMKSCCSLAEVHQQMRYASKVCADSCLAMVR
jgi:hypothetical protein